MIYIISVFIWLQDGGFPLQNSPKNLDPSYKMDLDFRDVLEEKNLSTCNTLIP